MNLRLSEILIFIVALVAIAAALVGWFRPVNQPLGPGYHELPKDSKAAQIPTKEIPVEKIRIIEKPVVVEKLMLPEWVKQDVTKQILATGEVPPYRGTTSVVAVLDTSSGATELIAKQNPLPLFGFEDEKAVGLRYSLLQGDPGSPFDGYARWTFSRVGNFYNTAGVSTLNQGRIYLESEYRW